MRQKFLHTFVSLMAVLCFLSSVALAQGTVTGTMLDKDSGDPLIGVKVVLQGTARGAITDPEGVFSFSAEAGEGFRRFAIIRVS